MSLCDWKFLRWDTFIHQYTYTHNILVSLILTQCRVWNTAYGLTIVNMNECVLLCMWLNRSKVLPDSNNDSHWCVWLRYSCRDGLWCTIFISFTNICSFLYFQLNSRNWFQFVSFFSSNKNRRIGILLFGKKRKKNILKLRTSLSQSWIRSTFEITLCLATATS